MKSDEIYDGVNAIDAVRDVLNACRSEESVKDASYSYVVTKTNTARELLGDFLDVILKEEYKDAYRREFICAQRFAEFCNNETLIEFCKQNSKKYLNK